MPLETDLISKEASLAAEFGANLATLSNNNANFPNTIENILYNVTILYGQDLGKYLSSALTEILFNELFTVSSKMLLNKISRTIIEALDVHMGGGSLARNIASNIMGMLGAEYARTQAKQYAEAHFSQGKIAKRIEDVLSRLKTEVDADKLSAEYQPIIQAEKERLLNPELTSEKEAKRDSEMKESDKKTKAIKRLEAEIKQRHEEERRQVLDTCSNPVTKGLYLAVFAAKDALGSVFSASAQVADAVYENASFSDIAILNAGVAGYYGMQQMTNALNQKIKFDITKKYSSNELYQLQATYHKSDSSLHPQLEKVLRFEMKVLGKLARGVYKLSSVVAQKAVYGDSDPELVYQQAIERARQAKAAEMKEEKQYSRERLMQEAQKRIKCPPEKLARYLTAYNAFRQNYSPEEVNALASSLPKLEGNTTFFSKADYDLMMRLYREEKASPALFSPVKSIRRHCYGFNLDGTAPKPMPGWVVTARSLGK